MIPRRASYQEITLYAPNRAPCRVDLSDNTNLWGVPPAAGAALREASGPVVTRYPALYAKDLKAALSSYLGVRPEEVVTGCGSDDVLDSAIRAFADPGDALAFPEPSFAMLPLFAKMNALTPVAVPLLPSLDVDAEAFLAARAKVIYLCSPNNPTGTVASREAVQRILEGSGAVVILDEAYAEFTLGPTWATQAPGRERLLVVRTLSKAFGLAGLRIGYAVGATELVGEVEKSRGPYKVSGLAERMGVAALTADRAWVEEKIAEARQNRARLLAELRQRNLEVVPSEANFLLVRVPDAARVAQAMRQLGVAVRPFAGLLHLGDAVRISIGPWAMLEEALSALDQVLA